MSAKKLALMCVAALAIVMPARADVILGYRIGLPPSGLDQSNPLWIDNQLDPINETNQPVALGPPIVGGLNVLLGSVTYLQITMATNTNALSNPTPSFPQSVWTSPNRLILIAFGLNYPLGILNNPYVFPVPSTDPTQNYVNARTMVPFGTTNPPNFTGYNMGSTAIVGSNFLGLHATSGQLAAPGERVIAVFRLNAVSPGTGNISLFDLNTAPTAGGFGLKDGQNLDQYVFHPSHNYLLPVVVSVPEPSSMALAGVALAGIGWRKWGVAKIQRPQD